MTPGTLSFFKLLLPNPRHFKSRDGANTPSFPLFVALSKCFGDISPMNALMFFAR